MADKEIKLKPCPFCGGEAQIKGTTMRGAIWISCRSCWAETFGAYSEEEAIGQWNRRAGDSDDT